VEQVKVAIVGAGPAGVGAAVRLTKLGIGPVVVIEREAQVGGIPAKYAGDDVPTYVMWTQGRIIPGYRYAEKLRRELEQANAALHLESTVIGLDSAANILTVGSPGRGKWQIRADAILLACGARESSRAERGWVYGHRPAGVYFTSNILDLARSLKRMPADAAVIGSEVMSYATAAKMAAAGAKRIVMADNAVRPRSFLPKRLFFYRWARPAWANQSHYASIRGKRAVEQVELPAGRTVSAKEVAITGQLTPNSELVMEAGLAVNTLSRAVGDVKDYRIGESGVFVAGNILGLTCSGQWAYFTGRWAAGQVAKYLRAL